MAEPIIIKKYPNRRLYDMSQHKYITFETLLKYVGSKIDFIVVDNLTNQVVTDFALAQAIPIGYLIGLLDFRTKDILGFIQKGLKG